MCVKIRLSATTLCWAVRIVNAPQAASLQMQGLSVTAILVSAGELKPTRRANCAGYHICIYLVNGQINHI